MDRPVGGARGPAVTAALTPPSWGPGPGLRVPNPQAWRDRLLKPRLPTTDVLAKARATETLSDECPMLGHMISPTTRPLQHGPPEPERPVGSRLREDSGQRGHSPYWL